MAPRLTDRQRTERTVAERPLMESFIEEARLLGWKVLHVSDSRRMVNVGGKLVLVGDPECNGWPSCFLLHPETGRSLAVEVKKESEYPTVEQAEWLDALSACGAETLVLRPSNRSLVFAQLRRRAVA